MPLTDADHAIRATGISGSEVAILVGGVNTFGRTEHDLYASKVLGVRVEQTEQMEMGHELERPILRRLARARNLTLAYPCATTRHPKFPLCLATPDALVLDAPEFTGLMLEGERAEAALRTHAIVALGEAKAVGIGSYSVWTENPEEVPENVYVQTVWGCFVRGLPRQYVGALIGTQVNTYVVEYDDAARDLAEALRERVEQWWRDHIVAQKPPRLDGSEGASRMVRELVGKRSNGVMLKASAEANEAARLYFEAKRDLEAAEERKREAQNNLIAICGETDGIVGDGFKMSNRVARGYHVNAYDVPASRRFRMA